MSWFSENCPVFDAANLLYIYIYIYLAPPLSPLGKLSPPLPLSVVGSWNQKSEVNSITPCRGISGYSVSHSPERRSHNIVQSLNAASLVSNRLFGASYPLRQSEPESRDLQPGDDVPKPGDLP